MKDLNQKEKDLLIKLNVEELSPLQVRLVKSITSLMAHVLSAEDEAEYFEASSNLLKKTADVIKESNFAHQNKQMNYGDQAVEFAVDFLNEELNGNKIGNVDN